MYPLPLRTLAEHRTERTSLALPFACVISAFIAKSILKFNKFLQELRLFSEFYIIVHYFCDTMLRRRVPLLVKTYLTFLMITLLSSCSNRIQEIPNDPRTPAIVSIEGLALDKKEIELIKKYKPVGVLLFEKNCVNEAQVIKLTNHLKSLGLLVAVDIEGKLVNRFNKFHPLQRNAVDFRRSSLKEIYDYHFDIAQRAKKLGIDIIFGPVTDVCNNPNSFLFQRCFSGDVERVSKCATTVVKAYQDAGIFPVIKHLPGHGKALDSHLKLPTVFTSEKELYDCDIDAPKAVINSLIAENRPLPGGMVAHVIYKGIDPTTIGTLSKTIIQKVIRNDIGIKNSVIFSDAMEMNALVNFLKQKSLATKKNYRRVALTKFLEAGGDIAILDSILNLEINPELLPPKNLHIMPKIRKFLKEIDRISTFHYSPNT